MPVAPCVVDAVVPAGLKAVVVVDDAPPVGFKFRVKGTLVVVAGGLFPLPFRLIFEGVLAVNGAFGLNAG